jgi:hypothetical protein
MELKSPTHKLTQTETTGEFQVWLVEKKQLHVREFRDGRKVRDEIDPPDEATKKLLAYANSVPLFAANWAGGRFNIDLDCGFSRFAGTKSESEVRSALRKCGFSNPQIKKVIAASKVKEHWFLRRY